MSHSVSEYVQAVDAQNARIFELLISEELNSETLAGMVIERDSLINRCLELLPDDERQAFAEKEYEVNQALQARCEALRHQSKESLSKFVKDVKAVRKYR